jgi:hypothetical protein
MAEHPTHEVLPANLSDHRAVRAWREVSADWFEPERIDVLKLKSKSAAYRLVGSGPAGLTVVAKWCPVATASIERRVYDEILPRVPLPALRCLGFVPEPDGGRAWLFVEDAGAQFYSPDRAEQRVLAGRWLGTLHATELPADVCARLPDRGPAHYLARVRSIQARLLPLIGNAALAKEESALLQAVMTQCEVMEKHWSELELFCATWPPALVHGDLVIKNLRLGRSAPADALLVFDWEMAGWGVPAGDLAQSLGRCASPDLEAYRACLQAGPAQARSRDIRRLAAYGNLLRMVDKIFWETVGLKEVTYEYLLRPISTLRSYQPELVQALRALHWR